MGTHRIHLDDASTSLGPGARVEVTGDEAKHAVRVKRLEIGAPVELLPGDGRLAIGVIDDVAKSKKDGWRLSVLVREVATLAPVRPALELWTSPPKGARLEQMIDQLAQLGVASWSPLNAERTVVHPREGKLERLDRVASEASKQCGRAWRLDVGQGGDVARALETEDPIVVGDATGQTFEHELIGGSERVRLLIGPEGDWSDDERARFDDAGVRRIAFGPHVMRIETAAVAIAAVVLHRSRLTEV